MHLGNVALAEDWKVQQLRCTVFLAAPMPQPEELYRAIVNEDPEVDENRPQELIRRQSGKVGLGKITVTITARVRIDILCDRDLEITPDGVTGDLGAVEHATEAYASIVEPWLKTLTDINRLAFGCVALFPTKSAAEGYAVLQRFLPGLKLDPGSSDLVYQINRARRLSSLPEVRMNRLMKWGAIVLKAHVVQATGNAVLMDMQQHFARLEVDINTPAEQSLKGANLVAIFDEFVSAAREIAQLGDVP